MIKHLRKHCYTLLAYVPLHINFMYFQTWISSKFLFQSVKFTWKHYFGKIYMDFLVKFTWKCIICIHMTHFDFLSTNCFYKNKIQLSDIPDHFAIISKDDHSIFVYNGRLASPSQFDLWPPGFHSVPQSGSIQGHFL